MYEILNAGPQHNFCPRMYSVPGLGYLCLYAQKLVLCKYLAPYLYESSLIYLCLNFIDVNYLDIKDKDTGFISACV